jgi:transcriptional regulator with XRE-family HTH domain
MTADLRDQLDARGEIRLTSHRNIGRLLRHLREQAGLTTRQLGRLAHVTSSGLSKREHTSGITAYGLIHHLQPLGYEVVLRPTANHYRPTGTGWPDTGALTPDRRAS